MQSCKSLHICPAADQQGTQQVTQKSTPQCTSMPGRCQRAYVWHSAERVLLRAGHDQSVLCRNQTVPTVPQPMGILTNDFSQNSAFSPYSKYSVLTIYSIFTKKGSRGQTLLLIGLVADHAKQWNSEMGSVDFLNIWFLNSHTRLRHLGLWSFLHPLATYQKSVHDPQFGNHWTASLWGNKHVLKTNQEGAFCFVCVWFCNVLYS